MKKTNNQRLAPHDRMLRRLDEKDQQSEAGEVCITHLLSFKNEGNEPSTVIY